MNKTQYCKGFWYYTDGSFLGETSHNKTLVAVSLISVSGLPYKLKPFIIFDSIYRKIDGHNYNTTIIIIKYYKSVTQYEEYDNIVYNFIVEKGNVSNKK